MGQPTQSQDESVNSSSNDSNQEPVKHQIGSYSVDMTPESLSDDGEFVEFEFQKEAVFRRLADDIYESIDAGIREPLTNSVTAIKEAESEGLIAENEGVLEIKLHDFGDTGMLTLRDNGIGISEQKLESVVSVIGRSTVRDDEELSGKFGMGFLALYKLVGLEGGFIMHSRSRRTDEYISGVWKSGGFAHSESEELQGGLNDNEYGTQIQVVLRDDIPIRTIRDLIEKYSRRARVPVIYEEYDEDGNERISQSDEYGNQPIGSEYEEPVIELEYETPYFRSVCSDESNGEVILLDVPIESGRGFYRTPIPGVNSIDIRLKKEESVVVSGPNKGLKPVDSAQYSQLSEDARSDYILKSELNSAQKTNSGEITGDIVMPGPIGTRDKLQDSSLFWDWLMLKFEKMFTEKVDSILEKINSTEDVVSLSISEQKIIFDFIIPSGYPYSDISDVQIENIKDNLREYSTITITEDLARIIGQYLNPIEVLQKNYDNSLHYLTETPIEFHQKRISESHNGDVYTGKTINKDKVAVVWEDDPDNEVIRFDDTHSYEFFEKAFGWKKLKSVSNNIDEFDVPESVRSRVTPGAEGNVSPNADDSLVVHFGRRDSTKKRVRDEDIIEYQNKSSLVGNFAPDEIVLFPTNSEYNISDYYEMASTERGLIRCSVSMYDELIDLPYTVDAGRFIENILDTKLLTSSGYYSLEWIVSQENVVFHVLADEQYDEFVSSEWARKLAVLLEHPPWDTGWNEWDSDITNDPILYVPVTESEFEGLYSSFVTDSHYILPLRSNGVTDERYIDGNEHTSPPMEKLWLYTTLFEWRFIEDVQTVESMLEDRTVKSDLRRANVKGHQLDIPENVRSVVKSIRKGLEVEFSD